MFHKQALDMRWWRIQQAQKEEIFKLSFLIKFH